MLQEFLTQPQTVPEDQIIKPSKEHSPSTEKWVFSVALITFLALFLRVFAVDYHSFWYDEAVTAKLTQVSLTDLVQGRGKDNGNPPFDFGSQQIDRPLFLSVRIHLRKSG